MVVPERRGYEAGVGRFRARARSERPEHDRSPMVQELIARLAFGATQVPYDGKDVLDYGCGTGAALEWLRDHAKPRRMMGLDVSPGAIAFARERDPGLDFRVLDVEGEPPATERFDVALCFEVLEHLHRPDQALQHLATRLLRPDGVLLASTPNRLVFSAGMEPSPINRTHIHEMDAAELRSLLERRFRTVDLLGMRFRDPARMAAHARSVRRACEGYRLLREWWWNPFVSRLYRWVVRGGAWDLAFGRQYRTWSADDFEFTRDDLERAIWFYAIARNPVQD